MVVDMRVVERMELKNMPFDKFVGNEYVHSTGYHCYFDDGSQATEYEDEIFEDAENCKYTYEQ